MSRSSCSSSRSSPSSSSVGASIVLLSCCSLPVPCCSRVFFVRVAALLIVAGGVAVRVVLGVLTAAVVFDLAVMKSC